jgi:hypothetical protein
VFQHGSRFYNFAGLRAYKEKFQPAWVPAYLICPRRALPFVIADIAALVGGGWLGLARRQPPQKERSGGNATPAAAPPASSTGRS